MRIICNVSDYIQLPEYIEFIDKNNNTQTLKLNETNTTETGFEDNDVEILGDIADEYDDDLLCLADNLQMVSNDFEQGLIWDKIIFESDEGTIIYTNIDNEINIDIQLNRKQENNNKDINNDIDTSLSDTSNNKSNDVLNNMHVDTEYIQKDENTIIIDGKEYCSFKRINELSESLSPEERFKIINKNKTIENKKQIKQYITNKNKENEEIER